MQYKVSVYTDKKVKVMVDGKPQTMRISARALKTLKAKNAL